jgi:hypothetical protein
VDASQLVLRSSSEANLIAASARGPDAEAATHPSGGGSRRCHGSTRLAIVPSRRRPKSPKPGPQDAIEQFAAMLRESAERERAELERVRLERQQARNAARAAAAHEAALEAARRELEQAIGAAREARRTGSGVAAADAAWRHAKAQLIELETGAPPEWANHA